MTVVGLLGYATGSPHGEGVVGVAVQVQPALQETQFRNLGDVPALRDDGQGGARFRHPPGDLRPVGQRHADGIRTGLQGLWVDCLGRLDGNAVHVDRLRVVWSWLSRWGWAPEFGVLVGGIMVGVCLGFVEAEVGAGFGAVGTSVGALFVGAGTVAVGVGVDVSAGVGSDVASGAGMLAGNGVVVAPGPGVSEGSAASVTGLGNDVGPSVVAGTVAAAPPCVGVCSPQASRAARITRNIHSGNFSIVRPFPSLFQNSEFLMVECTRRVP